MAVRTPAPYGNIPVYRWRPTRYTGMGSQKSNIFPYCDGVRPAIREKTPWFSASGALFGKFFWGLCGSWRLRNLGSSKIWTFFDHFLEHFLKHFSFFLVYFWSKTNVPLTVLGSFSSVQETISNAFIKPETWWRCPIAWKITPEYPEYWYLPRLPHRKCGGGAPIFK